MKGLAIMVGAPKDMSSDSSGSEGVSAKAEAAKALNEAVGSDKFTRLLDAYLKVCGGESEPDSDDKE